MLVEAGLEPRIRFRPDGEEVDGSFFHRGRVLLLEAKWTQEPQPASSIYQFRGKVEGKLIGTIGVFISMSGYSEDAVDALVAGKVINVILFDGDDMRAVATEQIGFADALDRKLRDAAETGTPMSPLRDPVSKRLLHQARDVTKATRPRAVIVEGQFDAVLVHAVADAMGGSRYQLEVVPAGGTRNLAALASAASSLGYVDPVLIIADGDGQPVVRRRRIENDLADRSPDLSQQTDIIVLDPSFEEALGITGRPLAKRRDPGSDLSFLDGQLQRPGVLQAAERNPQVKKLLRGLGLD
jgi:hypothetical protein